MLMFSKRKPDQKALAAQQADALRQRAVVTSKVSPGGTTVTAGNPVSGGGTGKAEGSAKNTTSLLKVQIARIQDVPEGQYIDFASLNIPAAFRESFAIIRTNAGVTMLVAQEAFATHPQFELSKRLREAKVELTGTYRADREVIKAIHAGNTSSGTDKPADSAVERIAWQLIEKGVMEGASDIHIETRGTYAKVYFRIFGDRVQQPDISYESAAGICSVLYGFHADASSKGTSWSPEEVKDTSIEHTMPDGRTVTVRFSSGPIYPTSVVKNFHNVNRLLVMDGGAAKSLESIGYTQAQVATIEEMTVGAQGMVLLVGPTNGGKSTSMQSIIQRIYDHRGSTIKVITVEKPVEYVIPNACQMGVPEGRKQLMTDGANNIYTTFLKGTLRQDPDVVMVGEIRSRDEAEAVKDLVLAGRKLVSTLHVYEAMAVYERLAELGVPRSVLYMESFVSGVIYQRLVPVLCPHCSVPAVDAYHQHLLRDAVWQRLQRVVDLHHHNVRVRGAGGCEKCNYIGIIGRTPCAELLVPDETLLGHLRVGNVAAAKAHWHGNDNLNIGGWGVTAVAHAISKMVQGILDPNDIEAQIGPLVVHRNQNDAGWGYDHSLDHTHLGRAEIDGPDLGLSGDFRRH